MSTVNKIIPFTFSLWLLTLAASEQSYTIGWSKIAAGGCMSTNTVGYSLSCTVGQHDAGGPLTGGSYSLTGGFWALYAVQTPGSPGLSIKLTATNTVMVYWPSPSAGFNLQLNTSVAPADKGDWVTP